jgi:hypothetical protein
MSILYKQVGECMRTVVASSIGFWLVSGCALPASGGNSSNVEEALTNATGGAPAVSSTATGGFIALSTTGGTQASSIATGGEAYVVSAAGGATSLGAETSGVGGSTGGAQAVTSSQALPPPCIQDAGASDAGLCNCSAGATPIPAATILRGGMDTASSFANAGSPFDSCAWGGSYLLQIPPNSVAGYGNWTFDVGDVIYSIGALTSLINNVRAAKLQMAIYSDASGMPDIELYRSPELTVTDTTNGAPAPEDVLPCPIRITTKGHYWLMLFSLNNGISNISIYMHNQNVSQRMAVAGGNVTTTTATSEWASRFSEWPSCPTQNILGDYPDFFVRLVPAN